MEGPILSLCKRTRLTCHTANIYARNLNKAYIVGLLPRSNLMQTHVINLECAR